jgi:hypothetical protein
MMVACLLRQNGAPKIRVVLLKGDADKNADRPFAELTV